MNYIEQINGFWAKASSDDLTGSDISVYFSLLHYCNKLSWINPFICHWEIVCQYSKVSKNTFYKSMDTLTKLGYINFEIGEKNKKKPKVFVLKFANRKGTAVGTEKEQEGNSSKNRKGTAVGTEKEQEGNIYKHINNETPENNKNNKTHQNDDGEGIELFGSENQYDFSKVKWDLWKHDYKAFQNSIYDVLGRDSKFQIAKVFQPMMKELIESDFKARNAKSVFLPKLITHLKNVEQW